MDLFNYTSDMAAKPIEVVIKHPLTGMDTDIVISVIGLDSMEAQGCLDAQQSKRFEEMSVDGGAKYDPIKQRDDVLSLLVACTVGWKNVEWQGDTLSFNKENSRLVYEKVPAIRDQVNKAVGDRKNFFTV